MAKNEKYFDSSVPMFTWSFPNDSAIHEASYILLSARDWLLDQESAISARTIHPDRSLLLLFMADLRDSLPGGQQGRDFFRRESV